jgi:DNA-binding beta-propeller fold protein YncE
MRVAASILALSAALSVAGPASATPVGQLTYAGCYTAVATGCDVTSIPKMADASDVAVSDDGRNVYATSFGSDSITRFDRDPATGNLTRAGCITSGTGCGADVDGKPGLTGAVSLAVSHDGLNVYVIGQTDKAVVTIARDPGTGALTYRGCVSFASGCGAGNENKPGLDTPSDVAVTPDGKQVFVAAYNSGAVTWLNRDANTGTLTWAGCLASSATGCTGGYGALSGAQGVAVSPDNLNVYVAAETTNSVSRLVRDPMTGTVTYFGCTGSSCGPGVSSLGHVNKLAVSGDGHTLYTAAPQPGNAVTTFDRDPAKGALTFKGCFDAGSACGASNDQVEALIGTSDVAVTSDGRSVYATANYDGTLVRFDRDPRDGSLLRRECFSANDVCGDAHSQLQVLTAATRDAASPDGRDVYSASAARGLGHFTRVIDVPPACAPPGALATTPGASVRAVLNCGDQNGDPFSVTFPTVPQHGALTTSADGGSVLYVPDAGYIGPDAFAVQAVDQYGTAGPVASVAVTVAPAPVSDTVRPVIRSLTITRAFRAAGHGASVARPPAKPVGATVRYSLSEAGTATFKVQRGVAGRKVGRSCKKPSRGNRKRKRCTRYVRVRGGFAHPSLAGRNSFHFSGRVRKRKLAPGSYRLVETVSDAAANVSAPKLARFRIVRR